MKVQSNRKLDCQPCRIESSDLVSGITLLHYVKTPDTAEGGAGFVMCCKPTTVDGHLTFETHVFSFDTNG